MKFDRVDFSEELVGIRRIGVIPIYEGKRHPELGPMAIRIIRISLCI